MALVAVHRLLETLFHAGRIEVERQYGADQVFRALADHQLDGIGADGRQVQFGAHTVDGDMKIGHGVEHRAIEVDDGGAHAGQYVVFHRARLHQAPLTAASSARMASMTAL
ncbi:hypothetical protein D3C72_1078110 [compost metagenome]